jgi:hypothetical protein
MVEITSLIVDIHINGDVDELKKFYRNCFLNNKLIIYDKFINNVFWFDYKISNTLDKTSEDYISYRENNFKNYYCSCLDKECIINFDIKVIPFYWFSKIFTIYSSLNFIIRLGRTFKKSEDIHPICKYIFKRLTENGPYDWKFYVGIEEKDSITTTVTPYNAEKIKIKIPKYIISGNWHLKYDSTNKHIILLFFFVTENEA